MSAAQHAPPRGWFHRGHHRGQPNVRLVLSWTHLGDDGLPLWEIPINDGDPALIPISEVDGTS